MDFVEFKTRRPPRGSMNAAGRRYYDRHFGRLVDEGVLGEQDYDAFLELCTLEGEKISLRKVIKAEGEQVADRDGNTRKHPMLNRLKDLESKTHRLAARFGLDPASKRRVKKVLQLDKDDFDYYIDWGAWMDETFQDKQAGGTLYWNPPDPCLRAYMVKIGEIRE